MLQLQCDKQSIIVDDDPVYSVRSTDNKRTYQYEYFLGEEEYKSSRYSLQVLEEDLEIASCILLACGGTSGVHEHSALVHQNSCIVAVGPFLASLTLPSLQLEWQTRVDWATCFGIYLSEKHECYISHGECDIARVSYAGELTWSESGKDIFTNGFQLHEDYIEVIDWNNEVYRIEISSGVSRIVISL